MTFVTVLRFLAGLTCVLLGILLEEIGKAGTWLVELGYKLDGDLE